MAWAGAEYVGNDNIPFSAHSALPHHQPIDTTISLCYVVPMSEPLVLNDRDLASARKDLARIECLLSGRAMVEASKAGFDAGLWSAYRKSLQRRHHVISKAIQRYEQARAADAAELLQISENDPGLALIVARIARGLSQKELAREIGLREQQIQRYEADRYRSISLNNYGRIARVLGITLKPSILPTGSQWLHGEPLAKYPSDAIKKVLRHGHASGWFAIKSETKSPEQNLIYYLNDAHQRYGSPALLRTGIQPEALNNDFALLSWRARVTDVFISNKSNNFPDFDPAQLSWVTDLIKLSRSSTGPREAMEMLNRWGIGFVYEPTIPGLRLDGAAFLVDGQPVIGLTLRYDRIDNFWFTLLHELGHVFLHLDLGMSAGFFDDLEEGDADEFEKEANVFASEFIVSRDVWRRSPARISKIEKPFADLAEKLGIHPALLFGRARKERNNYRLFSSHIGQGGVRYLFDCKREGAPG